MKPFKNPMIKGALGFEACSWLENNRAKDTGKTLVILSNIDILVISESPTAIIKDPARNVIKPVKVLLMPKNDPTPPKTRPVKV